MEKGRDWPLFHVNQFTSLILNTAVAIDLSSFFSFCYILSFKEKQLMLPQIRDRANYHIHMWQSKNYCARENKYGMISFTNTILPRAFCSIMQCMNIKVSTQVPRYFTHNFPSIIHEKSIGRTLSGIQMTESVMMSGFLWKSLR